MPTCRCECSSALTRGPYRRRSLWWSSTDDELRTFFLCESQSGLSFKLNSLSHMYFKLTYVNWMFKLRLEHSSKLHLSKQTMKRSTNYALLDQSWDRHTEADTTYDCCDHPEIGTLRRTHCNVDRLHFASGLVISIVFDPVYVNTLRLIPDVISPT